MAGSVKSATSCSHAPGSMLRVLASGCTWVRGRVRVRASVRVS